MRTMRGWVIAGVSLGLGGCVGLNGCVGINPEWEQPATEWMPESRCDAADMESEGDEDEGDDAREHEPGGASTTGDGGDDEACGVVEPDACGDGLTACASPGGWFCADLREHDEHCGACFHDCAEYGDATCHEGECYCRGGPWWKLCGEGCVDTRLDPTGCGIECVDCRVLYGPDARCETGICAPPGE